MTLEDRLSAHFRAAGEQISGPELPFATLAARSTSRTWWARLFAAAGALAGLGILGFGALQLQGTAEGAPDGQPTRVVVSPFVELSSQLSGKASTELFTVTTDQPSYWRSAALDTYEDDIWKMSGDFADVYGALSDASSGASSDAIITQDVEVIDLGTIWLPVAPEPFEVISEVGPLAWSATHGALAVPQRLESGDGLSYRVLSRRPNLSPDDLRAAVGPDPEQIAERYLPLRPGVDLSSSASALAEEIAGAATTRYDQAKLLQDYFRDFRYELNTAPSEAGPIEEDPIDRLLSDRAGIAPEFASAFAVMARDLGIPSRVAVGFTWGDPVAEDPEPTDIEGKTTYSVKGRHAHAWPEIYFPEIGWVSFEPTPSRGAPGATARTGAAADQASSE